MRRCLPALLLALILPLCACAAPDRTATEVTVLKIGKADAILIALPDAAVLVDAGEDEDAGEILENLEKQGIERLDAMIITHFDKDHVGGADGVLRGVAVEQVVDPLYEKDSTQYRQYLTALEETGVPRTRMEDGETLSLLDGKLTVSAASLSAQDDNNRSLCVLLDTGFHCFLLTGDAEEARIDELLAQGLPACDVVKLPHHGRWKENLPALLDATMPRAAILCDSEKNPAEEETLALLQARGIAAYQTQYGDIRITSDEEGLTIRQ